MFPHKPDLLDFHPDRLGDRKLSLLDLPDCRRLSIPVSHR